MLTMMEGIEFLLLAKGWIRDPSATQNAHGEVCEWTDPRHHDSPKKAWLEAVLLQMDRDDRENELVTASVTAATAKK